jgi:hypothetical protein
MKLATDRVPTSLSNVFFVKGDLLTHPCDLIVHQCNCLTIAPAGLATDIFKAYPEADLYSKRRPMPGQKIAIEEDRSVPGTCVIVGRVAAIFGQWRPGKVGSRYHYTYPEHPMVETNQRRVFWFQEGLQHMEDQLKDHTTKLQAVKIVAFPYLIGCGLAGGDWEVYLALIADFARRNPQLIIDVVVKE